MQTTRSQILQLIQRQGGDTVAGLARALGLAAATVRRHLDILQRDGLVTYTELRKSTGRPEHRFSLTEQGHEALPKDYDALLSSLMAELERMPAEDVAGKSGGELLQSALHGLGREVAEPHLGRIGKDSINAALDALRERNFEPDARASPEGLRVTLRNCPFRAVALTTNVVCAYDAAILSAILRAPVSRKRCISDGHECCEYLVASNGRRATVGKATARTAARAHAKAPL